MANNEIQDWIRNQISSNEVLLFMKGSPEQPQCGFSGQVVQMLNYLQVDFNSVNVLADEEIRSGIKEFSNWPTVPQLYVKSEFVGGADIIKEMFQEDELLDFFKDKGIKTK
ncbi:Grx4 family monothiol glutaredoxin [Hyphomicrobiales bacterium]|mgnify:FL=1|jgi:monothiol glutaredoxin|nr:Grx4 family monothiol glutaredoxin [Rhodobiaceae bacterium]MBT6223169.1 Grx4 family monothiol glutaredoxin [Rhodobiaceae bacterium]MDB4831889.1 Grx4 family monothiol glutaredoxin [Hyphomicrobiales bacterium]MDC0139275.1 Grx4 family monothiol glutaredoxin [Hyphomicrobiales bacterium]MDC3272680.1 Grx4 family monothiol glutaredoxin [Hyphomicrobiales bacterium]|tara:strand:+ start:1191 stop:1523 length:333 start_codon:yes stop_codon:yes gene_type:complete